MKKIRKIKTLKPKIREIKEIKHEEESELMEDIGEQSSPNETISEFKAPPIVLESNIQDAQVQQTQIQRETKERGELERTNITYATLREAEEKKSTDSYNLSADYSGKKYNSAQELPEQEIQHRIEAQPRPRFSEIRHPAREGDLEFEDPLETEDFNEQTEQRHYRRRRQRV